MKTEIKRTDWFVCNMYPNGMDGIVLIWTQSVTYDTGAKNKETGAPILSHEWAPKKRQVLLLKDLRPDFNTLETA